MSRSALAIFSWAVVTGLAMGKSSLSTEQALAMSLFVFAGSAQLAALPLIGAGFSVFTILITALIVNLRFVIFSIGVQAHFSHLPAWLTNTPLPEGVCFFLCGFAISPSRNYLPT